MWLSGCTTGGEDVGCICPLPCRAGETLSSMHARSTRDMLWLPPCAHAAAQQGAFGERTETSGDRRTSKRRGRRRPRTSTQRLRRRRRRRRRAWPLEPRYVRPRHAPRAKRRVARAPCRAPCRAPYRAPRAKLWVARAAVAWPGRPTAQPPAGPGAAAAAPGPFGCFGSSRGSCRFQSRRRSPLRCSVQIRYGQPGPVTAGHSLRRAVAAAHSKVSSHGPIPSSLGAPIPPSRAAVPCVWAAGLPAAQLLPGIAPRAARASAVRRP